MTDEEALTNCFSLFEIVLYSRSYQEQDVIMVNF